MIRRFVMTHWHWYALYAVPLVPLWFLVDALFHERGLWWVAWFVAVFTSSLMASLLEKYWPYKAER
jgi:hypothetical protein